MVCRNKQRARNARQDIIENTGNTGVQIIIADLSVQCDVRSAANKINHKFNRIDILVNNADSLPMNAKKPLTVSRNTCCKSPRPLYDDQFTLG